jgi:hypothetical protein
MSIILMLTLSDLGDLRSFYPVVLISVYLFFFIDCIYVK